MKLLLESTLMVQMTGIQEAMLTQINDVIWQHQATMRYKKKSWSAHHFSLLCLEEISYIGDGK